MNTVAFDLFAGLGGASLGLKTAMQQASHRPAQLVAVNHWQEALDTHRANHPDAIHYCEDVRRVDPRTAVPGGKARYGLAGPDCTHHSNARGGKPRDDGQRALAWDVVRWARLTEPEELIIENVPEFTTWGPTDSDGKPVKGRRGEYFHQFLDSLKALGYQVDWRILCAAHYGDATTRRRLFIRASRSRVVWPDVTHLSPEDMAKRAAQVSLFEEAGVSSWRTARDIIDWNLPGKSIFDRPDPLADKTMERIFTGIFKMLGRPFIVPQLSGAIPRSLDEPLNTITATGTGNMLVEPFIVTLRRSGSGDGMARPRTLDEPVPAICAGANHIALCEPFLIGAGGPQGNQKVRSLDVPLGAILGQNHTALIEPFLLRYNGGGRVETLDRPLTTADASNRFALIEPFLVSYYGNGQAHRISDPLPTATGKDRFGLVSVDAVLSGEVAILADCRFRMLQPHELAAAHSFPDTYHLPRQKRTGEIHKGNAVRMIGNSWPVRMATAVCETMIGEKR